MYQKIFIFLVLCILGSHGAFAAEKQIIRACEGEGCGCTNDKKLRSPAILYAELNEHSKIVAKLKANTPASLVSPVTVVNNPGRAIITRVSPEAGLPVKVGDEISMLWSEGEGFFTADHKGKNINFSYDQLEYEIREPSDYETWYEIKSGTLKGFTKTFPFQGCLE